MQHEWLLAKTANMKVKQIKRSPIHAYLDRYFVAYFLGITIYLHHFRDNDGDEALHCHPWWAISLILVGGYIQEWTKRFCSRIGWKSHVSSHNAPSVNFIGPDTKHRILKIRPNTWTLFIIGPSFRGWFFYKKYRVAGEKNMRVMAYQPHELTDGKRWWEEPKYKTRTEMQAAGEWV